MSALYDVYVVNDHGVHDVLYAVAKDYAERCAKELDGGVACPAGQRPEPKKAKAADSE